MIIQSVRVQNFRCLQDVTLSCNEVTALVGPNGSGKSSFLRALEVFYDHNAKYTEDDFYDRNTDEPILIMVTYSQLSKEEKELFKNRMKGELLTVEKELRWPRSQKYYGASLQTPDFKKCRTATSAAELKEAYNELRESGNYPELPRYTNEAAAKQALRDWESAHPDRCSLLRDQGQFFGFKEVGEYNLEQNTRFLFVPAVREASEDAAESRGSVLTELLDLVVRSVLAQREEVRQLQEDAQARYDEIMDPANLVELQTLESRLSETLKTYVPDAGVKLTWLEGDTIQVPMPRADMKLLEDEYESPVDRTGHGLQRAFILTMLQHLAIAQAPKQEGDTGEEVESDEAGTAESGLKMPNLIIGIEEPELYQHPNRQRHLSEILFRLAKGTIKGVAKQTQIIYSTHSPLFVDIKRFKNTRVLRKIRKQQDKPKQTKVFSTTLDEIAKVIWEASGRPEGTYTGETLEPRLQTLMTPWMNEGFFADVAVLVEGEQDRAAILGVADALRPDFESLGISVIPCMGKTNIDRPAAIFRELQISVYAVWDCDYGKQAPHQETNRLLLRLFGAPEEDYPDQIAEHFACFKADLTTTLCAEIGKQLYDSCVEECCDRWCLGRPEDAIKNPLVIKEVIQEAKKQGKSCSTLEEIISCIIALRGSEASQ